MATSTVGLKKQKKKTITYAKISPQNGEPQRYSWRRQKKKKKIINTLSNTSVAIFIIKPSTYHVCKIQSSSKSNLRELRERGTRGEEGRGGEGRGGEGRGHEK